VASAPIKEIGGRKWSFGTIPATQAVRVEVAIASVIGEPLFKVFTEIDEAGGTGISREKQITAATAALGLLTTRMDADKLLTTMKTVFDHCSCDGKPVDIDQTFNGRNKDLWEVFLEALKVNFADFFPAGLSASLAAVMPK